LEIYNDPQHYPWTMGFQPTFYREGLIHAQYILAHKPDAKIVILHQNNYSIESLRGLKDGLGDKADKLIVKALSYEESDPTINSQIVTFKGLGADAFYNVATPKFAALAIRKASEINWKPLHFTSLHFLYLSVDFRSASASWIKEFNWYYLGSLFQRPC
jgi:branched-chain amino acid transport system substrate-binding protein